MPLPPYCLQTRAPHSDKTFCQYCGPADTYQPIPLVPSAIQPMTGDALTPSAIRLMTGDALAPIELLDSPIPLRISTNLLLSSL